LAEGNFLTDFWTYKNMQGRKHVIDTWPVGGKNRTNHEELG
jgi:hypothetical protein